jgi:antitoxin component YwqK of YwqJK toxin-antitoxin module
MRHEKLIEKHLGINTPDWVKEKVNNAIDEALGYNLKKSEELTPHIEHYTNGNVLVKGQKNSVGEREGLWEWFYPNGNIKCRIPYKNGKEDGIEEVFYENGNISMRIPYKEGKMDGIREWFDKQWNIKARIPFKEGKEDGIAEWFDEQGNITETRVCKNGEVIEITKPELTPHIEYYGNGNVKVKGQRNSKGQREGIWEWFFENGNILCRTPYKEGNMDGIEELFYENGNTKWRIPYKNGVEDGVQECFDEQGNITATSHWKDGEVIEETKPELKPYIKYWGNGNVCIKGQENSKGQEEGIWEWFRENGIIHFRIPYKEGKEDGIVEWFYSNGNTYRRTPCKEGKEDGIEERFDEQGNITETRHWKDGEIIEETKH